MSPTSAKIKTHCVADTVLWSNFYRNDAEWQELKQVYKAFFGSHGDPLALHEAAIAGNLYGFLSKTVQGLQDRRKFERLMENPYPLPDPDSDSAPDLDLD